jgi:hypothetical protein
VQQSGGLQGSPRAHPRPAAACKSAHCTVLQNMYVMMFSAEVAGQGGLQAVQAGDRPRLADDQLHSLHARLCSEAVWQQSGGLQGCPRAHPHPAAATNRTSVQIRDITLINAGSCKAVQIASCAAKQLILLLRVTLRSASHVHALQHSHVNAAARCSLITRALPLYTSHRQTRESSTE